MKADSQLKFMTVDLRVQTAKLARLDVIVFWAAGELKEYVVEEVNVRNLKTCADPLQYCTLRAEPDYPSLGKRLGKAMATIGKAVKGMTTQQILDFETQGKIELEGESLGSGEIRVGCTPILTGLEGIGMTAAASLMQ